MLWVVRAFRRLNMFLAAAAVLLAAGTLPLAAAPDVVVTDIRVGKQANGIRVVLETSGQVDLSIFTLADPYRVVVDLPQVGWRLPTRPLPRDVGQLQKLRYGLFKPGQSRLVLDLRSPAVVVNAFLLRPGEGQGFRAVIDLEGVTHQAFVRSVRTPRIQVAKATPPPPVPVAAVPKLRPRPVTTLRFPAVPAPPPQAATPPSRLVATPPSPLAAIPPTPKPLPAKRRGRRTIVIDPGHGGADPGTTGVGGSYEKHITLAVAREIKRDLEATGRYRVVLTRSRDVFVRLRDRTATAREADADLFISIHANAIENSKIRGLSIYTLSEKASDAEAAALAEKENKSDLIAGIDLSGETAEVTNILIDLAQRETMNQSARLAAMMVREFKRDIRLLRNTHRFAGFAVLKAPDVPAVLLELGFLSNRRDERALQRKGHRAKLAAAIRRSADRYFYDVEEARRR